MDYWRVQVIFVCKACGILGGSGGMLPWRNFDFGPFIRWNLGLFSHKQFIVSLYYFKGNRILSVIQGGGGQASLVPRPHPCG